MCYTAQCWHAEVCRAGRSPTAVVGKVDNDIKPACGFQTPLSVVGKADRVVQNSQAGSTRLSAFPTTAFEPLPEQQFVKLLHVKTAVRAHVDEE